LRTLMWRRRVPGGAPARYTQVDTETDGSARWV
jgi:hypothetical protein